MEGSHWQACWNGLHFIASLRLNADTNTGRSWTKPLDCILTPESTTLPRSTDDQTRTGCPDNATGCGGMSGLHSARGAAKPLNLRAQAG